MTVVRKPYKSCSYFLKATLLPTFEITAPITSSKLLLQSKHISVSKSMQSIFQTRHFLLLQSHDSWTLNSAHSSACPSLACCCYILGLTHSSAHLVYVLLVGLRAMGCMKKAAHLFLFGLFPGLGGGRGHAANCWCYFPFLEEHTL